MFIKYALAWTLLAVLAVGNGVIREMVYGPRMTERAAHQISTISAILLFTLYTVWLESVWPLTSMKQAAGIGGLWLCLTLAFEFSMVCLVQKRPLSDALAEYDLKAGRLWILVLVSVAVLPWAVFHFSG